MTKSTRNSKADAERAVKDLQKDFEKRIDAIRTELKENDPKAAQAVEKSLSDLKAGMEDRLSDLSDSLVYARESFDDALETGRTTIQERPLMAIAIAIAVGVAVGMLLGRKNRD
jgi:ElaB/YqjD/DUF883 family membrane-anchored ribosome-binding protein